MKCAARKEGGAVVTRYCPHCGQYRPVNEFRSVGKRVVTLCLKHDRAETLYWNSLAAKHHVAGCSCESCRLWRRVQELSEVT